MLLSGVGSLKKNDVYQRATQLFEGNESAALKWFNEPNRTLRWRTPAEIMNSESGKQIVVALITRIEQGVYS